MSKDLLRRAAASMRERAEAVDGWYSTKAWATTAPMNLPIDKADAAYIAAWHPAVALAVADLLDAEASWAAERNYPDDSRCLAVARAYLRPDAP